MMWPLRASSSTTESAYLLLDSDLCSYSGAGRFGWWTFMKFTLMKNGLLVSFATLSRNPTTPFSGVSTYARRGLRRAGPYYRRAHVAAPRDARSRGPAVASGARGLDFRAARPRRSHGQRARRVERDVRLRVRPLAGAGGHARAGRQVRSCGAGPPGAEDGRRGVVAAGGL